MSDVIKVEDLSKQYRLGEVGTGSLAHDINRIWHKVRGKEDPYLKIGDEINREITGKSDYVWALKDVTFEIEQGDRVGIIGRNGAGKSTLLKILSRTTSPTSGSVKIKGRVASLLEVGTGFHPELSGRDNIFLNGAILGMSKRDIKSRFDEILDFAGVERYIDTPVKRYSSGMYVRLAFAVAAHLESDILIVDEVLAVGDAEFQKKCFGKMNQVSDGEGKTVLFVSHNIGATLQLCQKGIVLDKGCIQYVGNSKGAVDSYNSSIQTQLTFKQKFEGNLVGFLEFKQLLINKKNNFNPILTVRDNLSIEIHGSNFQNLNSVTFVISMFIGETRLFTLKETPKGRNLLKGEFNVTFSFLSHFLRPGQYSIAIGAWMDGNKKWIWGTDVGAFKISETWMDNINSEDTGLINADFFKFPN